MSTHVDSFVIARNPAPGTRLPFLLRVPVEGEAALVLACREDWPGAKDAYCHEIDGWPEDAEVLERLSVQRCWRAGKAVHLVLDRRLRRRSMFVSTEKGGRTLVFWRTQKTMRAARPGLKVGAARGLDGPLEIAVDYREQHAWRFAQQQATCARRELPVGDYGVFVADRLVAAVERKSIGDLAAAAVGGKLQFALAELSRLPRAALVVEGRLSDLLKSEHVKSSWMLSVIAALQVAHPHVSWLFAETRDLAEDFAFRWLAAARKVAVEGLLAGTGAREAPVLGKVVLDEGVQDTAASEAASAGVTGAPGLRPAASGSPGIQLGLLVNDRAGRIEAAARLAREGRVWTTAEYASRFGVSGPTAWNDLTRLVEAGVLVTRGGRRDRRYVAAGRIED